MPKADPATRTLPAPVTASIRKSRGQAIAREMFDLVRTRWADLEEAKNTATMVLWLAEIAIYPAEPLLKSFRLRQRAIALVWLVAKSKPGIRAFGQDGCIRLGKAAANYACLQKGRGNAASRALAVLLQPHDGARRPQRAIVCAFFSAHRDPPPEDRRQAGLGFQSDSGSIGRTDDADDAEP